MAAPSEPKEAANSQINSSALGARLKLDSQYELLD